MMKGAKKSERRWMAALVSMRSSMTISGDRHPSRMLASSVASTSGSAVPRLFSWSMITCGEPKSWLQLGGRCT